MSAPDVQSAAQFVHEPRTKDVNVDDIQTQTIAKPEVGSSHPPVSRVSCQSHPLNLTDVNSSETQNDVPPESPQASVCGENQKKSKRVVFPNDGSVVLGFMPPRAPWNDASSCSTDDLLGAYRRSCDRHGVRPLTKLMQQLGSVTDFSEKKDSLVLRGENLDSRHVETLEEVFRRLQYHTIDMEATRLDEEGAVALFEMIEYYESCSKLNISYNKNLGNRGWQACSRMIKKTPCLDHLEVRGCTFPEQMMPCFGRALRMGSVLTVLHMENTSLSGRPLLILVAAIKMNEILRELYLADNKLMPSDGIQLGNMLKYNHRLQLLDVRNNHLQDLGTSNISDGIWEQSQDVGLNTLVLWNNQITYQSMASMRRALLNTKSLETLNLGHNNLTTEGIHRLKEGLLQNKSLKRIGLQASKITCEGAVALAEFIAESSRLMRLDLRENDIKTAGLMALSLSLKVSQSVTRIDLDKDPKRENSMRDYAEQQTRLLKDISNYMMRNRELQRQQEEEAEAKLQQKLIEEAQKIEEEAKKSEEKQSDSPSNVAENQVVATDDKETLKTDTTELTAQEVKQETDKENLRKKFTLNLVEPSPSTASSSLTLESPKFTEASQLPELSATLCDVGVTSPVDGEGLLVGRTEVSPAFPLSPMMSDQGHPMLARLITDTALLHNIPNDVKPFKRSSSADKSEPGDDSSQSSINQDPTVVDQSPVTERTDIESQSRVSEATESSDQSQGQTEEADDCVLGPLSSTTDSLLLVCGGIEDDLCAPTDSMNPEVQGVLDDQRDVIVSTKDRENESLAGLADVNVLSVTEGGEGVEGVTERGEVVTEGGDKVNERVIEGSDGMSERGELLTEGGDGCKEGTVPDEAREICKMVTEGGDVMSEGGKEVAEKIHVIVECEKVTEGGGEVTEAGDVMTEEGNEATEGGNKVSEGGDDMAEGGEGVTEGGESLTEGDTSCLLNTALGINGMRAELANALNDLAVTKSGSEVNSADSPPVSSAPS